MLGLLDIPMDIPAPTGELTEEGVMALMEAIEKQQASNAALGLNATNLIPLSVSTPFTVSTPAETPQETTINPANICIHGRDKYRCKECGGSA
jgi:hypothetical protein